MNNIDKLKQTTESISKSIEPAVNYAKEITESINQNIDKCRELGNRIKRSVEELCKTKPFLDMQKYMEEYKEICSNIPKNIGIQDISDPTKEYINFTNEIIEFLIKNNDR